MLVSDLLKEQSRLVPQRSALIFQGRAWTYLELEAQVNRCGHYLLSCGVTPAERVAVLGRNSDWYVIAYFALARIGAVMVPINFWFQTEEIRYVIEQSGCTSFIVDRALADRLKPLQDHPGLQRRFDYPPLRYQGGAGSGQCLLPDTDPGIVVSPEEPHIILYTSGTTGFPKGALLSHRNHVTHAQYLAQATDQRDGESTALVYPLFHTGGPDCVVLPHFAYGGACVVLERPDPDRILDAVDRYRLNSLFCVPTVWRRILRRLADSSASPFDFSCVRRCLGSSDTFAPSLLENILQSFPNSEFYQTYGLTEAGCILTVCRLTRDDRSRIDSVGRPLPCTEVRIVDETGLSLPAGETGELVARGPTVMTGYWNLPDQTAEAMRPIHDRTNTSGQSLPWLHTGDLARLDEAGYVYIAGRKKDVIISGGENIYPAEIERVLREHDGVRECAVIGVPDEEWGESVMAVVVPAPDAVVTEEDLIAFVRGRLAGFKKPRRVIFQDRLPVTPATGKLQRVELRKLLSGLKVAG